MHGATPILSANAVSCLIFGGLLALSPDAAAAFLSDEPAPAVLLRLLGIALIAHAAHLQVAAMRRTPRRGELRYFAVADAAWVAISLGLASAGVWITRPAGVAVALLLAATVALLGLLQWHAARTCEAR